MYNECGDFMKETQLYNPVKQLLESNGYLVKAEVKDVDVMAIKDEYNVIVELKTQISLKLIYQAVDRQKLADKVYVALPSSVIQSQKSNYKYFALLLKRLDLGLIKVYQDRAEIILETFGFDMQKSISNSNKRKIKLMNEFSLRNAENVGGTKGRKMTLYREKAIEIAKFIYKYGESSPKEIKKYTKIIEASGILQNNYYKWFKRVDRGIYHLTELGLNQVKTIIESVEINEQ